MEIPYSDLALRILKRDVISKSDVNALSIELIKQVQTTEQKSKSFETPDPLSAVIDGVLFLASVIPASSFPSNLLKVSKAALSFRSAPLKVKETLASYKAYRYGKNYSRAMAAKLATSAVRAELISSAILTLETAHSANAAAYLYSTVLPDATGTAKFRLNHHSYAGSPTIITDAMTLAAANNPDFDTLKDNEAATAAWAITTLTGSSSHNVAAFLNQQRSDLGGAKFRKLFTSSSGLYVLFLMIYLQSNDVPAQLIMPFPDQLFSGIPDVDIPRIDNDAAANEDPLYLRKYKGTFLMLTSNDPWDQRASTIFNRAADLKDAALAEDEDQLENVVMRWANEWNASLTGFKT